MGARSFRMGLILGFISLAAWATPACGGSDEDEGSGGSSGSGGKGGSAGTSAGTGGGKSGTSGAGGSAEGGGVTTKDCKGQMCKGAELPSVIQSVAMMSEVAPCCAGANGDKCGLDTSLLSALGVTFPEVCQAKNQPGTEDANCPKATFAVMGFNIEIPGCCRPVGKCGYLANKIGAMNIEVQFDLGCVDSAPFLDGGTPPSCSGGGGDGSGGSGGSSGDASSSSDASAD